MAEPIPESLEEIFKRHRFIIPQYQRAYSWEADPHLKSFVEDLRQQAEAQKSNLEKKYFLGTLLLHKKEPSVANIVDGQQRLTTAIIFIASALKKNCESSVFIDPKRAEILHHIFIEDNEQQKLTTITEDHSFFRSYVLGITESSPAPSSPSSINLQKAMEFFLNEVKDEEWEPLINVLISAKILRYTVNNPADATLIFELQNDRGKTLTDLEALKSFLMHLVYLNAKNPDAALEDVQSQFSGIYREIEKLSQHKRTPTEDAILSYHCVAYLPWTDNEWRNPKKHVKQTISQLDGTAITQWVQTVASDIHETYKVVTELYSKADEYTEFVELLLIDRMASFWPLIIKAYRSDSTKDKTEFLLCCRLMEVFAMRGYGLSNIRSSAGLSSHYTTARDFSQDWENLKTFLYNMSYSYDIETRHKEGLESAYFYTRNPNAAKYLLWKYENKRRFQAGNEQSEPLSWKRYIAPKENTQRLSIEHIAAQNNPIAESLVEWEQGVQEVFADVALHRLGNLVIDSVSGNAHKGKKDFSDKLESLTQSIYVSQSELASKWAMKNEQGTLIWTHDSVQQRHKVLKRFAENEWNPNTWFSPNRNDPIDL